MHCSQRLEDESETPSWWKVSCDPDQNSVAMSALHEITERTVIPGDILDIPSSHDHPLTLGPGLFIDTNGHITASIAGILTSPTPHSFYIQCNSRRVCRFSPRNHLNTVEFV